MEKKQPHLHNRSIALLMRYVEPEAQISSESVDFMRTHLENIIMKKTKEAYRLAKHGDRVRILPKDLSITLGEST